MGYVYVIACDRRFLTYKIGKTDKDIKQLRRNSNTLLPEHQILYFYEVIDNKVEEQRLLRELNEYRIKNSNGRQSEVVRFNSRREARSKLTNVIDEEPLIKDDNCIIV